MIIDRECWGFVVALITNMESTALGSFLYFLNSFQPLTFYYTLRPLSLCLIFPLWHNIFSPLFVCLFWFFFFDFFIPLMHLPLMFFLCRTSWGLEVKEEKGAKGGAMKSLLCGITEYRPTDRPNQWWCGRREEWVSTRTHTFKTLWRTESNHTRRTEHSVK